MLIDKSQVWYSFYFAIAFFVKKNLDRFYTVSSVEPFYCAKLKLVIEVDGDTHFSFEAQAKDKARTNILQGYGLEIIRFNNDDVLGNFEAVCEEIQSYLDPSNPP